MDGPPNNNKTKTTIKVKEDEITVRDSVWLMAAFIISIGVPRRIFENFHAPDQTQQSYREANIQ